MLWITSVLVEYLGESLSLARSVEALFERVLREEVALHTIITIQKSRMKG